MTRWLLSLALILGLAAPLAANTGETQGTRIEVVAGKSTIISSSNPVSNIILGNPDIADVVVMSPDRVYFLGKALGTTNVQLLDADGRVIRIYDLVVGADLDEARRALVSAFPGQRIEVHSVNGGIRLSGSLPDQEAIDRAVEIARNFLRDTFSAEDASDFVINTLTISDPPQVFLEVRIIEVARSVSQQLSSSMSSMSEQISLSGGALSVGNLGALNLTLEAMADHGLARLLATPTLTAQSGETASFLAGGEVPIPIPDGDGGTTIEFKEFGVRLTFTPKVMPGGVIRLELEPEVSQLDTVLNQNNLDVPAFSTRRANTTVTLRDGESFAIAGLLQDNSNRSSDRFPILGDLPIIGALFRDSQLRDDETDLLIMVTPSLTRPVRNAADIASPFDGRRAADGWNFFGEGKQEVSTYMLRDALAGKDITGAFGPILTLGGTGTMVGAGR